MSKPFDATLKDLIYRYPDDWLSCFAVAPDGPVEVQDADLSTVTASADRVLIVRGPRPWIADIEPQSAREAGLVARLDLYRALLRHRYNLPVHTLLLLLRRAADAPGLTGHHHDAPPVGESSIDFRYQVGRVWTQPVQWYLEGGIGTLPLAPLARVRREDLPALIRRMDERLRSEEPPEQRRELWTATYVLLGLRYPAGLAARLLATVRDMEESVTYQEILAKGEARGEARGRSQEARDLLVRAARRRLGEPSPEILARIEAAELETVESWVEGFAGVECWEELIR